MIYTYSKKDSGMFGDAFELEIKRALKRKNADRVSPCGRADFFYKGHYYDSKQNGTCLQYHEGEKWIKGSSRVIYATHISYNIVAEDEENISFTIDLLDTQMFELDRKEFIDYMQEVNNLKVNRKRGTVNVQSVYNYKRDAWHGAKGRRFEEWAYSNELEDNIIDDILEGWLAERA